MSNCNMGALALLVTGMMFAAPAQAAPGQATPGPVWTFDNLTRIGGEVPKIEGQPTIVDSPVGKAIHFNGSTDALLFPQRPLVGAKTFTIEAIIHPEGGMFEQRFMHIAETDPRTGLDANPTGTSDPNPRIMFELRAISYQWYLDAFVNSKAGSKTLAFPDKRHPLGPWYVVAQTYDGKTYRTYVDGVLQGEADVPFTPQGRGHMMIGARMNHISYFHGAIAEMRFTPHALTPDQFLKLPPQKP